MDIKNPNSHVERRHQTPLELMDNIVKEEERITSLIGELHKLVYEVEKA